jgi:hypothetical protein
MKKFRFLFICIAFLHISNKVDAKESPLELEVSYVLLPTSADPSQDILQLIVFLKNKSDKNINIITGSILDQTSSKNGVLFIGLINYNDGGELIKPSPVQLDIVSLGPGEVAKIRTCHFPLKKVNQDEFDVGYDIDPKFGSIFGCWTGSVEKTINLARSANGGKQKP